MRMLNKRLECCLFQYPLFKFSVDKLKNKIDLLYSKVYYVPKLNKIRKPLIQSLQNLTKGTSSYLRLYYDLYFKTNGLYFFFDVHTYNYMICVRPSFS